MSLDDRKCIAAGQHVSATRHTADACPMGNTFAYEATHLSNADNSEAMALLDIKGVLVLVNEEGYAWNAEPGEWRKIGEPQPKRDFEVEVLLTFSLPTDEDGAAGFASTIMQKCWETYHAIGMASQSPIEWEFEVLEGAAADVTDREHGRDS